MPSNGGQAAVAAARARRSRARAAERRALVESLREIGVTATGAYLCAAVVWRRQGIDAALEFAASLRDALAPSADQ